jgi:hypothetical protein
MALETDQRNLNRDGTKAFQLIRNPARAPLSPSLNRHFQI